MAITVALNTDIDNRHMEKRPVWEKIVVLTAEDGDSGSESKPIILNGTLRSVTFDVPVNTNNVAGVLSILAHASDGTAIYNSGSTAAGNTNVDEVSLTLTEAVLTLIVTADPGASGIILTAVLRGT